MKFDKLWIRWVNAYYLKGASIMHWQVKDYWEKSMQQQSFKTNEMYIELRGEGANKSWKHFFSHNHARPHACFIMWLAL